ncbi:MAG TPA: ABC transporter substrate-binding protein [Acidimicrobiales bacterium]|jgi:peptide/nickel transport system substrate-binding protein|nr:ABC transporter substrate-binding protein [Acidimicrobiales bacterium]
MAVLAPGRRRWKALAGALLALSLVAAACGDDKGDDGGTSATGPTGTAGATTSAAPATPVAGGTATVLLFSEIATLDPVKGTGSGGSDGQRFHALYGGLVYYDASKNAVVPLQAQSLSPKGTNYAQWQLVLKAGMTFTDGTPFNADAVKVNWERAKVPENACPCRGVAATLKTLTVVNDTTLDIELVAPNAHFDKNMSRITLNYIASAKAITDKVDLTSKPVGAGPFTLDQWIRDDRMIMSKNPAWKGSPGPYLDKLTFRVVGDEDQRIDTFNTGQADAFYTSTPGSVDRATKAVKDSYYASVQVTTGQTFVLNNTTAPFNDLRIRKALVQGVDWKALADTVFGKGAIAADNFTLKGTPWYTDKAALPKYDPAAAQALIDDYVKEKGGPVKIDFLAFQQTLDQQRVKFIQTAMGQLKNIQINVQVNDSPTNIGKVLRGEYQASSWGFPTLDPDPGLYNSVKTGLATNYSKYTNPAVDAALDQARQLTDQAQRATLYQGIYEQLAKDLPFFPYVVTVNGFVAQPRLKGASVQEDGIMRFDLIWLSK